MKNQQPKVSKQFKQEVQQPSQESQIPTETLQHHEKQARFSSEQSLQSKPVEEYPAKLEQNKKEQPFLGEKPINDATSHPKRLIKLKATKAKKEKVEETCEASFMKKQQVGPFEYIFLPSEKHYPRQTSLTVQAETSEPLEGLISGKKEIKDFLAEAEFARNFKGSQAFQPLANFGQVFPSPAQSQEQMAEKTSENNRTVTGTMIQMFETTYEAYKMVDDKKSNNLQTEKEKLCQDMRNALHKAAIFQSEVKKKLHVLEEKDFTLDQGSIDLMKELFKNDVNHFAKRILSPEVQGQAQIRQKQVKFLRILNNLSSFAKMMIKTEKQEI